MRFINDYVFRLNTNKRLSANTKVILYVMFSAYHEYGKNPSCKNSISPPIKISKSKCFLSTSILAFSYNVSIF